MRLTPLDIHHKEFRHALRGYSEEEVDSFLDEVANEFERVFKENIDYKEGLEQLKQKVVQYEDLENTLHNTLLTAQRTAEDVQGSAKKEAELIIKDAELKAKEIIQNAFGEKEKLMTNLSKLKEAEGDFRSKFKSLLETHLKSVNETVIAEAESVGIEIEKESATEDKEQSVAEERHADEEITSTPTTEKSTTETPGMNENISSQPHYLASEAEENEKLFEKDDAKSFEDLGDEEDLIYRID